MDKNLNQFLQEARAMRASGVVFTPEYLEEKYKELKDKQVEHFK